MDRLTYHITETQRFPAWSALPQNMNGTIDIHEFVMFFRHWHAANLGMELFEFRCFADIRVSGFGVCGSCLEGSLLSLHGTLSQQC